MSTLIYKCQPGNRKRAASKKLIRDDSPSNCCATDMSTGYEWPTYDNKSGPTKVKYDQVNCHYCQVSGK